jgi:hypothetical protein
MATPGAAERRRMLPAIALLLRLAPAEVARIAAALDAAGGGGALALAFGGEGGAAAGGGAGAGSTPARSLFASLFG